MKICGVARKSALPQRNSDCTHAHVPALSSATNNHNYKSSISALNPIFHTHTRQHSRLCRPRPLPNTPSKRTHAAHLAATMMMMALGPKTHPRRLRIFDGIRKRAESIAVARCGRTTLRARESDCRYLFRVSNICTLPRVNNGINHTRARQLPTRMRVL